MSGVCFQSRNDLAACFNTITCSATSSVGFFFDGSPDRNVAPIIVFGLVQTRNLHMRESFLKFNFASSGNQCSPLVLCPHRTPQNSAEFTGRLCSRKQTAAHKCAIG